MSYQPELIDECPHESITKWFKENIK